MEPTGGGVTWWFERPVRSTSDNNRGGAYLKRAWLPRRATFGGKGGGHAAGDQPPRSIWVLKVCTKCKTQQQPLGPRGGNDLVVGTAGTQHIGQ